MRLMLCCIRNLNKRNSPLLTMNRNRLASSCVLDRAGIGEAESPGQEVREVRFRHCLRGDLQPSRLLAGPCSPPATRPFPGQTACDPSSTPRQTKLYNRSFYAKRC